MEKQYYKSEAGFSLVELIIVVAIMAILIGVLAPQYIKYVEKSRVSADLDTADSLLEASHSMLADLEYFPSIDVNSTITFGPAGISTDCPAIRVALTEYYSPGYETKTPKSKKYKNSTYKILFAQNAKKDFLLQEGWQ